MRAVDGKKEQAVLWTFLSWIINVLYGICHAFWGIITNSLWLITIAAYYFIIGTMRFSVIIYEKTNKSKSFNDELFVKSFSGCMFMVLSVVLIATTCLSVLESTGFKYHEYVMIAIAAYTFTKVVWAVIQRYKSRKCYSPVLITIKNISFADALASVFSLQRSMLVSFEGMANSDIRLFNVLTGTVVCLSVVILGINLIQKDREKMAKSNIIKVSKRIANIMEYGYRSVRDAVVGGYKRVEVTVVGGYQKIENFFVDRYLTHGGETVEEAKNRLKNNK